jgi:hypothetical protein
MGSPVSFWKWQSLPGLLFLEWTGREELLSEPVKNLPELLVCLRFSSLWCWLFCLWVTQVWVVRRTGRRAAFWVGLFFAIGPNLMAHGSILTMEMPLTAFWTLTFLSFELYLIQKKPRFLLFAGIAAGLSFSMKFTGFLLPFLIATTYFIKNLVDRQKFFVNLGNSTVILMIIGVLLLASNLVVTGFDTIPISQQTGAHPWLEARFSPQISARLARLLEASWPVDWVGFITQMRHQSSGGPSYLLGEVSSKGWWYYYPVTIGVKVPLVMLLIILIRLLTSLRGIRNGVDLIPTVLFVFLLLACVGSKRNYGFRYMLPMAPMTLVWISSLFRSTWFSRLALPLVFLLLAELLTAFPYPLVFFNQLAGGTSQGRWILADSNLDWGQGLISLKKMQDLQPDLKDLTLFYFGDIDPAIYGINGSIYRIDASDGFKPPFEAVDQIKTKFIGVSTSLIQGPWGPDYFFRNRLWQKPLHHTSDFSVQIFRSSDIAAQ